MLLQKKFKRFENLAFFAKLKKISLFQIMSHVLKQLCIYFALLNKLQFDININKKQKNIAKYRTKD
jgi:hypothetical protein